MINLKKGQKNSDFQYYISNEYKAKVLASLCDDQLVDVILTRPTYKVRYVPRNTFVEPVCITFRPLGNLLFCRDQQITTQKGVVLGSTNTWPREMEHIIMKQVFQNLKVDIISEMPLEAFLEGGDFFVAKEDLCMLGVGTRTNVEAADFLMKNDLLGTKRFAMVYDETDRNQQRMHLDTFFNILSPQHAVVLDFEELSKINGRYINRKVYLYSKDPTMINSDNKIIPNNSGDYNLIKIFDDFYSYLQYEKYELVKVSNKQQEEYMINFLNIGNNRVISVNPHLKDLIQNSNVNDIEIIDINFDAVVKLYGAVHCATQVSRSIK